MVVNFVGNYQTGYVGEQADQVHITREMESLGHTVKRVPQDIWKAYCDGETNPAWVDKMPVKSDINIITKWHHFTDGSYIKKLREVSGAPVFYWVWDYMYDEGFPEWHMLMAKEADLYLTNEYGIKDMYKNYQHKMFWGIDHVYYFPFDVCDGSIPISQTDKKEYDVVFLGSCIGQGHRIEWLTAINNSVPVTCFSWNYEEWQKRGFRAYPAVYGEDFNRIVAKSKIILGFNVNPNCWGYWSNRVGKVIRARGFLLQEYAPGMELMIGDAIEYFSSPQEAVEKIKYYLEHEQIRIKREENCIDIGERFTSKYRVKQLMILIDRYLKSAGGWDY